MIRPLRWRINGVRGGTGKFSPLLRSFKKPVTLHPKFVKPGRDSVAMKKITLTCCIVLAVALGVLLSGEFLKTDAQKVVEELKEQGYIPIKDVLPRHESRIQERINLLKGQSLDESFMELLEEQQYTSPSYLPPGGYFGREDVEMLLSARTFLKVLQEFEALPQEQATGKLYEYAEKALDAYNAGTGWTHYMLCTAMLLVARAGEYELLLHMLDEMDRVLDRHVDFNRERTPDPFLSRAVIRGLLGLDDSAVLTILMHALQQTGIDVELMCALEQAGEGELASVFQQAFGVDFIPLDVIEIKFVELCRWDAPLTHYDFANWHGEGTIVPKDVVELFPVYMFSIALHAEDEGKERKFVLDILKRYLEQAIP